MTWPRLVVLLSALPFAGVGLAFVAAPVEMARLVGLEATSVTADNDLRGVWGGLSLGCAALLAWCGARETRVDMGVRVQLFLYGGLASGRAVSLIVAGAPDALGLLLHGGEIVGVACGASAWAMLRRQGHAPDAGRL
jgi:hypothetical protein